MKTHPYIAKMLDKGKMIRYGAKAIPEGGYWSIPKNYGDGFLDHRRRYRVSQSGSI